MEFNSNKAIYLLISDIICEKILSGELKADDRIPSVREYGASIGVNPNTVMRTYEKLTNEGINLAGVTRILDLQGRLDARDEEIDDLHKRVRRLADRVHELETRESVNSLVQNDVGGVTPGAIVLRRLS